MESAKKKVDKITTTEVTDLKLVMVKLGRGTYLIDGEVISNDGYGDKWVGVKDVKNIRMVDVTRFITHYENPNGDKMAKDEYDEMVRVLLVPSYYDDEDESIAFPKDQLDAEYDYKKFKRDWVAIYKTVQEVSEPLLVETQKTRYNTGNKHITSFFFNSGGSDLNLFSYSRASAYKSIVTDYMTKLGFVFSGDKNNYDINKEWCNSTHSGIRYAKAFGSYLFSDKYDVKFAQKGTLADMIKLYNEDKVDIEAVIYGKYVEKFGKVDEDEFDFNGLLDTLRAMKRTLGGFDVKNKSVSDHNMLCRRIDEVIKGISGKFEVMDKGEYCENRL